MAIWIVNGSEKEKFLYCDRKYVSSLAAYETPDTLKGWKLSYALSYLYSDNIYYQSHTSISSMPTNPRQDYDFFKYKEVQIMLSVEEYNNMYSFNHYVDRLTYASKSVNKDLLCIYTENEYGEAISFYHESLLKRKHKIYAILKNSVEFIPNEYCKKPVICETHNYKIFKEFIAPSLLNELKTLDIIRECKISNFNFKDVYTTDLYVGGNNTWQHEIKKAVLECLPMIKEKLFDGKFKEFCDRYNVTDISLLSNIVGEGRYLGFDISNLEKEEEK